MANARLLSSEMEPSLISDNDVGRIITLSISLSLARRNVDKPNGQQSAYRKFSNICCGLFQQSIHRHSSMCLLLNLFALISFVCKTPIRHHEIFWFGFDNSPFEWI